MPSTTTLTTLGLRHLALNVIHFEACLHFYTEILGMKIEWQPDPDNVYLTSGQDNLALHRAKPDFVNYPDQRLDHFGFILSTPSEVDRWHEYLLAQRVAMVGLPKTHRDGARSFYCQDPDGNTIQFIYHSPIVLNVVG